MQKKYIFFLIISVLVNLIFYRNSPNNLFDFSSFLFDSVDYIADAVLGCPRWTDQRGKETDKVGYLLFPLDDSLLVLADFGCLELERVMEVVVGFTAYLCAC